MSGDGMSGDGMSNKGMSDDVMSNDVMSNDGMSNTDMNDHVMNDEGMNDEGMSNHSASHSMNDRSDRSMGHSIGDHSTSHSMGDDRVIGKFISARRNHLNPRRPPLPQAIWAAGRGGLNFFIDDRAPLPRSTLAHAA